MKLAWFSILFLCLTHTANAGWYPWGWNGWLQSVPTIADAPTSGVQDGSVVSAQDTEALYIWTGSAWVEISGGGGSSVTSISIATANGFAGSSSGGTTPILTLSETVTGIPVGNGTSFSSAASSDVIGLFTGCTGTDYLGADGACHALPAGVTPGGSNTDVQFNSSGAFGGDAGFTYASGNATLSGGLSAASANISGLTASEPVVSDGSKNLASGSVSSPLTFSAGAFGCQTASGSQAGCLSSTDWSTFNGKQDALTFDAPLVNTAGTVTCDVASGSQAGCLSSSDWTTFNNKGTVTAVSVATANGLAGSSSGGATPALTLSTTVTGLLQGNGTAISAASTTGSGNVVLATSPTLVTPALGTPSSATLTNATGLPVGGIAAIGADTLVGNNTGSAATPSALTVSQVNTMLGSLSNPMTTTGDIIYGGASGLATRLAGNTASTTQIYTSTGTGSAAQAPTLTALAAIAGSVTSTTSGQEHLERAFINGSSGTCSSSPCTLDSNTPGISSVTRSAAGTYLVNFLSSTFSNTPTCIIGSNNATLLCAGDISGASSSSYPFSCFTSAGVNTDARFAIICMGPQ